MQTLRRIFLILLLLLVLIFGPGLIVGYADLSLARLATSSHESSYYYEWAAERLPWYSDLYEAAGVSAIDAGEYARAASLLQTSRQKGTLAASGQFELGRAYYLAGNDEEASAEWKNLLEDATVRGSASEYLAEVYHSHGQFDDEQKILRRWLDFDPTNLDAKYRLGLLLFAQASPDAFPLLEAVASGGPAALKAHVEGLRSTLRTALEQPSLSASLVVCGRTLAAINEWPLAGQTFLHATQADPTNGLAWAWLGEARQQLGNGDAAASFGRALTLSPASGEIHAMAGLYRQRQGDWQKALVEFETAARLEPQNAVWQMSLGDTSVHLGDLVKALAYYQAAVSLAPKDAQTWSALALFSVENGVDVEGVGRDAALQAYALQPDSAQNMDTLGRALMATGQWDTAELFFKKAMAASPDDAAPPFHLGLLYLQTNKSDQARQYLKSAQALDPNGPIGTQAAHVLARYLP